MVVKSQLAQQQQPRLVPQMVLTVLLPDIVQAVTAAAVDSRGMGRRAGAGSSCWHELFRKKEEKLCSYASITNFV